MKVYLAGGMRHEWRNTVEVYAPKHEYLNPTEHKLDSPEQYTHWDLLAIRQCDILFGYLEESNPSGYGLALEIGYAKALNKLVILVEDKQTYYWNFIREVADVRFDNLHTAIKYLECFR